MADQADDLSIPTSPVRAMAATIVPQRVPDQPRPGAEPAHSPISPRQQTEAQFGSRDDGVDRRTLIVGARFPLPAMLRPATGSSSKVVSR